MPFFTFQLRVVFFHRAHQALYLHRLRLLGSSWYLAAGQILPDMNDVMRSLAAQDEICTWKR
jgi:D-arabinitol 4-dehydrogenase